MPVHLSRALPFAGVQLLGSSSDKSRVRPARLSSCRRASAMLCAAASCACARCRSIACRRLSRMYVPCGAVSRVRYAMGHTAQPPHGVGPSDDAHEPRFFSRTCAKSDHMSQISSRGAPPHTPPGLTPWTWTLRALRGRTNLCLQGHLPPLTADRAGASPSRVRSSLSHARHHENAFFSHKKRYKSVPCVHGTRKSQARYRSARA